MNAAILQWARATAARRLAEAREKFPPEQLTQRGTPRKRDYPARCKNNARKS